jgi:hypothetical protein
MESCKEFHIVTGLSNICVKCKLQLTNNEHLKVEDLNKDFLALTDNQIKELSKQLIKNFEENLWKK